MTQKSLTKGIDCVGEKGKIVNYVFHKKKNYSRNKQKDKNTHHNYDTKKTKESTQNSKSLYFHKVKTIILLSNKMLLLPWHLFFVYSFSFKITLKQNLTIPMASRGVKAVTISGYWQKPLTVTALAVIKFH
jgi:hypothetical protein